MSEGASTGVHPLRENRLPSLSKTAILVPETALPSFTGAPSVERVELCSCVPLDGMLSRKEGRMDISTPFPEEAKLTLEGQHHQDGMLLLASLLDLAYDAIIVRDPANRIVFWNQGAERLYGWSAQEAMGHVVIIPMVLQIHNTIVLQMAERNGKVRAVHFWIFGSFAPFNE